jgi:hypothetical protein
MRRPHLLLSLVPFALFPRSSDACGLTPPIGPNGLPTVCHGDENAVRLRAGATVGGTATTIDFGTTSADLVQGAGAATLDVYPLERLGLSVSLGTPVGGYVDYLGERYDLSPGLLGGAGISYRFFGGRRLPFVHTSLTLSFARATAVAPDDSESTFTSKDFRAGVAIGKALGTVAAPFVVARYFGAGTDWSVAGGKGSDRYRYHVGVGSAFGLSDDLDALVEVAPLGEKRASLGLGYSF